MPASVKIELVQRLQDAGLKEIEVTSFVSPKWVPQMADNAEVMAGIARDSGVLYSVLTPNLKGFEAAVASRPDEIVVFGAASEAFSQKNINCSIAESIERFAPWCRRRSMPALPCAAPSAAPWAALTRARLPRESGLCRPADEGHRRAARRRGRHHWRGHAHQGAKALEATLAHFGIDQVSGHFHDTYGQALSNTLAALELGVWNFQSSVAGLGGCPMPRAPRAMWPPKTWFICCRVWALKRVSIWTNSSTPASSSAITWAGPRSRVAKALLAKRAG